MEEASGYQIVVDHLYALYLEKGFLNEEEALDFMSTSGITLVEINRATDKLLALGVVFTDYGVDDLDDIDRAQTNYEALFDKVLTISPFQEMLINYIREIRPPQNREWRSLIIQMNSGNDYAFNRLFDMYLRVVIKIALRFYIDSGFELDDAIQEGSMGLIRAIKQYDGSKHGNLASYLPLWIQQYISRAIADKGRTIRIPVHAYDLVQKIKQKKEILFEHNGREPTLVEIATAAETTIETVTKLLEVTQDIISLDYMLQTEDGQEIINNYSIVNSFNEEFEKNMLTEQIHKTLSSLKIRERQVISLRFGLVDGKERTLEEVGAFLNVTRERIRQIEIKALRKMRHSYYAENLKSFLY